MRLGVDARLLSEPLTGIGRYTAEMCRALVQNPGEFFLYTPKPPLDFRIGAGATVRAGSCPGRISKMIWSQTLLPRWAAQDRVDVFWGATHRLPRFLPERIARVVTIHDLVWKHAGETMRPTSRLLEWTLMPSAVRLADRIIADSHSTAEQLEAEFASARGKIRVVHLGATPLAHPEPASWLTGIGVCRPYFLFVGTLEPRKNLQRLLRAFAILPEAVRRSHQFVVAGGKGWGGVDVLTMATELGIRDDIVVTGYVSDSQLSTLYANAIFLAMPSVYEGFGLPLVEAMSCGVPVLTSNTSSLPEVAGKAGLLVDPLSEQAIANGLTTLLGDPQARQALALQAETTARRFSWKTAAEQAIAVFEEALHERRTRSTRREQ
ncbi:D-inositol 3-phosphate glycosyltransferase [compost metagenome]